jgi:hypothetical protein
MTKLASRLNDGGRVYVESASPLQPPALWRAIREDRAGAVRYALYEVAP